jgi:hypothetical protein
VRGLLVVAAVLWLAAPAAAQAPVQAPAELGISANRVFNDSFDGNRWNLHLGGIRDAGIGLVRTDAFWEAAEPDPPKNGVHTYHWTLHDFIAVALANHGIRWQPILDYSALWASSVPGDDHAPPREAGDYAAYAAAFARRYGRGGTVWDDWGVEDPQPVTTYEIWNEPNLDVFWKPRPDPARYMELYAEAKAAIEAVDPEAVVLVGGLVPGTGFERALYATRPDAAELIEGIAFHPYAPTAEGVLEEVRRLRRTLEEVGDPDVPIHVTEVGWVTSGDSPLRVTEEQRARYLEEAVTALAWSDCGIASVIPYTWTTPESNPDDMEDWYGIVHPDGTRGPSADAYARVVAERGAGLPKPVRRVCHAPPDADADGQPDDVDLDDDADGAPDGIDAFPLDPAERGDADGDGSGDNADPDDDNDGVRDPADAFPLNPAERADADADGGGDNSDPDDDNDGRPDSSERARGTSTTDTDSDDDGLGDGAERRTDPLDRDSDGDRLPDGLERGIAAGLPDRGPGIVRGTKPTRFLPDRHPRTKTLATRADSDRDGRTDRKEDRDRDGRRDRAETDPNRRDTDGDGLRDGRDRHPLDRRRR